MLRSAIVDLAARIRPWLDAVGRGEPGPGHAQAYRIKDEPAEVIAYLTIRTALNRSGKKNFTVTRLATAICRAIAQEQWLRDFRKQNRQLFNRLQQDMSGRMQTADFKQGVWKWAIQKSGFQIPPRWPVRDQAIIGVTLIDMLVEATGWFTIEGITRPKRRPQRVLQATKTFHLFVQWWAQTALIKPDYLPTVIPPSPWTSVQGGGYHTDELIPLTLVKTRDEAYLRKLSPDMPVFAAVNAVQSVPWRVNTQVLDVLEQATAARMQIGRLPMNTEGVVYEPRPKDATKEQASAWRLRNIRLYEAAREAEANWMQTIQTQRTAAQFRDFDAIYFPHTMDFRGRMYPVVPMFNPQGTDVAKGLLLFANGKPLSSDGFRWLYIHGANCWDNGLTKLPFETRCDWVRDNYQQIVQSALHPLDYTWWSEAEEPWQFLAFCFEFYRVSTNPTLPSHLPVGQDGTCNGLQHFSAMLRDPVGGQATNLLPGEAPSDIYQRVADVVTRELQVRCAEGDLIAKAWLEFGIDRKATKRPVMTLPYGSTQFSCQQYTRDWYTDKAGANRPFSPEAERPALAYLGALIWDSIGKVVVAARSAMAWLKECSDAAGRQAVEWELPSGFPVKQAYKENKMRRVSTVLHGTIYRPALAEEMDRISPREQRNGISPNFVHSYDAEHMRMTVLTLTGLGIDTFAFVHDNYLSLAEDAPVMARVLRETFVELHSEPALDRLARQLTAAGVKTPVPPECGTLDLQQVTASPYFFA